MSEKEKKSIKERVHISDDAPLWHLNVIKQKSFLG
jgi:hypothetical protein